MSFFDSRFKLAVHIGQFLLVKAVLIITAVRLLAFSGANFGSRGNTIALAMGAKSLIIIGYQVLTEHFQRFRRWHSFKANAILNSLEIVFWGAVCFLMIQANIQRCAGTSCILSWVVVSLSIIQTVVAGWTAVVTIREFRDHRAKVSAGDTSHASLHSTVETVDGVYMGQHRRK